MSILVVFLIIIQLSGLNAVNTTHEESLIPKEELQERNVELSRENSEISLLRPNLPRKSDLCTQSYSNSMDIETHLPPETYDSKTNENLSQDMKLSLDQDDSARNNNKDQLLSEQCIVNENTTDECVHELDQEQLNNPLHNDKSTHPGLQMNLNVTDRSNVGMDIETFFDSNHIITSSEEMLPKNPNNIAPNSILCEQRRFRFHITPVVDFDDSQYIFREESKKDHSWMKRHCELVDEKYDFLTRMIDPTTDLLDIILTGLYYCPLFQSNVFLDPYVTSDSIFSILRDIYNMKMQIKNIPEIDKLERRIIAKLKILRSRCGIETRFDYYKDSKRISEYMNALLLALDTEIYNNDAMNKKYLFLMKQARAYNCLNCHARFFVPLYKDISCHFDIFLGKKSFKKQIDSARIIEKDRIIEMDAGEICCNYYNIHVIPSFQKSIQFSQIITVCFKLRPNVERNKVNRDKITIPTRISIDSNKYELTVCLINTKNSIGVLIKKHNQWWFLVDMKTYKVKKVNSFLRRTSDVLACFYEIQASSRVMIDQNHELN